AIFVRLTELTPNFFYVDNGEE
ncbi:MAG: hypothetical protein K0R43_4098, partial [Pseudoduganella sp.]|nr:hypothetical protein [Pseudoduganella sp.]